ncbi:MAG TPA: PDZ domain-containing protein [Solirubrobacteraceae bacterium]|nr:PDZ domain-containing protein [Solirubrobacteraceae bacterium]
MTQPKHLWAGDWERDSAAAADDLANLSPRAWPQHPETERPAPAPVKATPAPAPVKATPPPPARPAEPRRPQERRRVRRPSTRAVLLSLIALLLIAGAAYGVSTLGGSSSTAAAMGTPWLGARLGSLPTGGALVSSVTPGGPAASAGLKPGDVIIQIQGRPVSAAINVSSAVGALNVGDSLQILAVRMGHEFATTVTLGSQPPASP